MALLNWDISLISKLPFKFYVIILYNNLTTIFLIIHKLYNILPIKIETYI
jgi:hypothetical protein